MMHTLRCARHNWHCKLCNKILRLAEKESHSHCPECDMVVPREELAKHMDLAHRDVSSVLWHPSTCCGSARAE